MSKGVKGYSIVNHYGEDMTIATAIKRGCYMSNYLKDRREARSYFLSSCERKHREGHYVSGSVRDFREEYALKKGDKKQPIETQALL